MKETVYCPNCDYRLELEDDGNVSDGGDVVTSCPSCFTPLVVKDGELLEDKDG